MKKIWTLLFVFGSILLNAQSISELEKQLREAETSQEKMNLNYDLAEAWLSKDVKKAIDYGKAAHNRAQELSNNGMLAQSSFVISQAYNRVRGEERKEETWLKSALGYAKNANDGDLIIKAVDKLSRLAIKNDRKNGHRKAYQYTEEAFKFFSQRGRSISELDRRYDKQKAFRQKEQRELMRELDQLTAQLNRLGQERDKLSTDKTVLTQRTKKLEKEKETIAQEKEIVEQEIAEKEEEIKDISREKLQQKMLADARKHMIENLENERVIDSLALQQTNLELQNATLQNEQSKYVFMLMGAGVLFVILLALLNYYRFRAKKRLSNKLEQQNHIIEEERQRSDELLLNILPANIANELKEKGKATARKFNEASILFADFKNFTRISTQLTPEKLVEEIDTTFKAFDNIISHYDDIEKIKTVGDAYICASGLVNRKTIPANLIKAALEMQEYLEDMKHEKIRRNEPFFEARIGIHTGPVVAGVVGLKKFAYDIWGDTVNIAARMESNCEPGKVNVSESTYRLIKYNYDCQYRGKVAAKGKGMIDMYYVQKELA
jgi:class 3 adenylate cyclase